MIDFAFIVGGLAGMGAFAATWSHFAKWVWEGLARERKNYLLQIQHLLAMEELNRHYRDTSPTDRTLDGIRAILRSLDTIEGLTLAEAEVAARAIRRSGDHRHMVKKYRLKRGMRIL